MDEQSHTPGPWRLSDETLRDGLRSKLIYAMPEGMLATVRVEHQGRYFGGANARLISAAPELLAALKDAIEWINSGDRRQPSDLVRAGLAAIAKAEADGAIEQMKGQ